MTRELHQYKLTLKDPIRSLGDTLQISRKGIEAPAKKENRHFVFLISVNNTFPTGRAFQAIIVAVNQAIVPHLAYFNFSATFLVADTLQAYNKFTPKGTIYTSQAFAEAKNVMRQQGRQWVDTNRQSMYQLRMDQKNIEIKYWDDYVENKSYQDRIASGKIEFQKAFIDNNDFRKRILRKSSRYAKNKAPATRISNCSPRSEKKHSEKSVGFSRKKSKYPYLGFGSADAYNQSYYFKFNLNYIIEELVVIYKILPTIAACDFMIYPGASEGIFDCCREKTTQNYNQRKPLEWVQAVSLGPIYIDDSQIFFGRSNANHWQLPNDSPHFIGRKEQLSDIRKGFKQHTNSVVNQVVAGLAGIGKTQLALSYAYQAIKEKEYDYVIWWTADNTLDNELFKFANRQWGLTPAVARANGLIKGAQLAHWIYARYAGKRLLICFDNAVKYSAIAPYLPKSQTGFHCLITSRNQNWGQAVHTVYLNSFSPAESSAFIQRLLPKANMVDAAALGQLLGYLPLALSQAIAYVKRTPLMTLQQYQTFFITNHKELLNTRGFVDDSHQQTVLCAIELSLKEIQKRVPLALQLLLSCVPVAAEDIPQSLLLAFADNDLLALNKALTILTDYSLIIPGPRGSNSISIHRLVHTVLGYQETNPEAQKMRYINVVTKLNMIRGHRVWGASYIPHLRAIITYYEKTDGFKAALSFATALELLGSLMITFKGDPQQGTILLEHCLRIRKEHSNDNDTYNISALFHLSVAAGDLGDIKRQRELFQSALSILRENGSVNSLLLQKILLSLANINSELGSVTIRREILHCALNLAEKQDSTESLVLSRILEALANVEGAIGNLALKKSLLLRSYGISKAHYDVEHFELGSILGNLGSVELDLGNIKAAKKYFLKSFIMYKKRYGCDNFKTAKTLIGLGSVEYEQGNFQEAKKIFMRILNIKARHYGVQNIKIINVLQHLAVTVGKLGNIVDQQKLLNRARGIARIYYPPKHYKFSSLLVNLSDVERSLDRPLKAETLLNEALEIQIKHYGNQHPWVAKIREKLGYIQNILGEPIKAEKLFKQSLKIFQKFYSPIHYKIAHSLVGLSNVQHALGYFENQKELLLRALEIQINHYGSDHIEVALTRMNLGVAEIALSHPREARKTLNEALEVEEKHYGRGHFKTVKTMANLATAESMLKNTQWAKVLLQCVLGIKIKHYKNPQHLNNAVTLISLARIEGALKNTTAKIGLLQAALKIQEKHDSKDYLQCAATQIMLADAYSISGQYSNARKFVSCAITLFQTHSPQHRMLKVCQDDLSRYKAALKP